MLHLTKAFDTVNWDISCSVKEPSEFVEVLRDLYTSLKETLHAGLDSQQTSVDEGLLHRFVSASDPMRIFLTLASFATKRRKYLLHNQW